jgi:hypothetical protein
MHDDDRQLREQLRGADPAQNLVPLPSTWLDHRMEQIMTEQNTTPAPAVPARTARRTWIPVVGVAAALAIAAAVALPLALGGSPTVEQLAQPTGGDPASGSCMIVSPEGLLMNEQAFAASVLTVEGDVVTLEVTERFTGEVADRVEVPQVDAADGDYSGVPFEVGESYLVAATDGTIAGCGLSGTDIADLRAVYDAAFSG